MKKFNEFNKWSVWYVPDDNNPDGPVDWLGDVYLEQIVRYFEAWLDENLENEIFSNIRECLEDEKKQLYIPKSYYVWPRRHGHPEDAHVVEKGYYVFKDEGCSYTNKNPRDIDDPVYRSMRFTLKPQSVLTFNKEDEHVNQ